MFPSSAKAKMTERDGKCSFTFYVFSPRPLDDLLIEPDMPKLTLVVKGEGVSLELDGKKLVPASSDSRETQYRELPLLQGWNRLTVTVPVEGKDGFSGFFRCDNKADFIGLLKGSYVDPEVE